MSTTSHFSFSFRLRLCSLSLSLCLLLRNTTLRKATLGVNRLTVKSCYIAPAECTGLEGKGLFSFAVVGVITKKVCLRRSLGFIRFSSIFHLPASSFQLPSSSLNNVKCKREIHFYFVPDYTVHYIGCCCRLLFIFCCSRCSTDRSEF